MNGFGRVYAIFDEPVNREAALYYTSYSEVNTLSSISNKAQAEQRNLSTELSLDRTFLAAGLFL